MSQIRTNNNANEKKTSFYQSRFAIFDNNNSAMRVGFAYSSFNHFGYIEFAPVLDAKRGKEAAKGESIYDYENRQIASIMPQTAVIALMAFNQVLSGEADEVSIPLNKDGSKFLSFCNTLAVYGEGALPTPESVSPMTIALVGTANDVQYEILNVLVEREMYSVNNGETKVVGCPEIDLMLKFFENCVNHATTGTFTDAVAAVSLFGGSKAAAEERTPPPQSATVKRGSVLRGAGSNVRGAGTSSVRTSSTQQQAEETTEQAETTASSGASGSRFNAARNAGRVSQAPEQSAAAEETSSLDDFVGSLGGDDAPDFSQDM
jgi:hypothetical protein